MKQTQFWVSVSGEFHQWFDSEVSSTFRRLRMTSNLLTGREFADAIMIFTETMRHQGQFNLLVSECKNVTSNRKLRKEQRRNSRLSHQLPPGNSTRKRIRFKLITTSEFREWFLSIMVEIEASGIPSITQEEFADALMLLIERNRMADDFDIFATRGENIIAARVEHRSEIRNLTVDDIRAMLRSPTS